MNHGTKPNETDCGTSCFLMRQIFSSVVGKKKTNRFAVTVVTSHEVSKLETKIQLLRDT